MYVYTPLLNIIDAIDHFGSMLKVLAQDKDKSSVIERKINIAA